MALIAKMTLDSTVTSYALGDHDGDGTLTRGAVRQEVKMRAVASDTPENKTWARYTPDGELRLTIDNPDAFDKLKGDCEYYVEIREVVPARSRSSK